MIGTDPASPKLEEPGTDLDPDPGATSLTPDLDTRAELPDARPTPDPDQPGGADLPHALLPPPADASLAQGTGDGAVPQVGFGLQPGALALDDVAAAGAPASDPADASAVGIPGAGASSDEFAGLIVQGHEAFYPDASIAGGWDDILPEPICACQLSNFGAPLIGGRSQPNACLSVRVDAALLRDLLDQLHVTALRRGDDFVLICLLPQGLAAQSFGPQIFVQGCMPLDLPCPELTPGKPLALVVRLFPLVAALKELTGVLTLRLDGPGKRLHVESDHFACPLVVYAPEHFPPVALPELGLPLGPPVKPLAHEGLQRAIAYVARVSASDDLEPAFGTVTLDAGRAYAGRRSCVAVLDDPKLPGFELKLHHTLVSPFLQGLAAVRPGGALTAYNTMFVLADETTAFGVERSKRTFPRSIEPLIEPTAAVGQLIISRGTLIWALTLMKRALRGGGTGKGSGKEPSRATGKGAGKPMPPAQGSDTLRLHCAAGFPVAACELTGMAPDGRRTRVQLTVTRRGADETVLDVRLSLAALLDALEADQATNAVLVFAHGDKSEGGKPEGDASDPGGSALGAHEAVPVGPAAVIVLEEDDHYVARTIIATVRPPPAKRRSRAGKTKPVPEGGFDDPSPLASEA